MDVIQASSVMGDAGYGLQGHDIRQNTVLEPEIQSEIRKHGLNHECVYQLGHGLDIAHLVSNDFIDGAPAGLDELFCRLQKKDLRLSVTSSSTAASQLWTWMHDTMISIPHDARPHRRQLTTRFTP